MSNPVYQHPDFVLKTDAKIIESESKRLWLSLKIDKEKSDSLLVILKNPSRATKDISDKTVYTVTKYVHINKLKYDGLKSIGNIIILNLIPFYQTYSDLLVSENRNIFDKENFSTIEKMTSKHKNVIIAWGNHPDGLYKIYEELKTKTLQILKKNSNNVFYVDRLSKFGNPKHGQIWGYENELKSFSIE